jgi:ribosomal-protein-alanine N-acetyltransferase
MTVGDLPEVLTIEQRVYEYPWSDGIFRDCLRAGQCCWIIRETGALVAYGVMLVAAGESHLLNLCVDPDSTRRGYGRGLLEHLQGLALRHHATVMFLEVRPSNRGALALYRDNGFAEVGLRRGYYPAAKGREDALVMARELGEMLFS